jgi:F0F1-type ATP synthase delta subunit
MASRSQVAEYVARQLPGNRTQVLREAASWLIDTGRAHQAKYLAGDVAKVMKSRGYVYAVITSAHPLSATARESVEQFIKEQTGAGELELEEIIKPDILGGVLIELPDSLLDATIKTKLAKFVQGVN